MARHRSRSTEFKCLVIQEYLFAQESLHSLSKRTGRRAA